jgi:iron complex outermembrane receptor protein
MLRSLVGIALCSMNWSVDAQSTGSEPTELPTVRVEAERESDAPVDARPDSTLRGEELRQKRGATLGATLQDELGVANSSFGPGVGLPVIRGMTGPRVRILLDGLGSHDASSMSPDHAITIDPLLAEEVRIIRGPAVIRHGGAAIGGAVEVIDARIPTRVPKLGTAGTGEIRYNSNGSERSAVFKLDAGRQGFAVHVDGFHRSRGNLDIPGAAIDEAAIVRQFGLLNATNTFGYVGNTNSRSEGATVGASAIGARGYVGISYGTLQNNYGIPAGAHTHSHGPGPAPDSDVARIDMKQQRHDLKGRLKLGGILEALEVRVARVNYQHAELDNGVAQTVFSNDVLEGRVELEHAFSENMTGRIGTQFADRTFAALGAEAFVPRSSIRGAAGYLQQQVKTGPLTVEFGMRRERQHIRPDPQLTVFGSTVVQPHLTHAGESFSLGATLQLAKQEFLTATVSRAKRSPDVQELFALGPHLATRTFDIGNNRLRREMVEGIDLGFSTDRGTFAAKLNVFRYRADDFIYQRNAGLFYDPDVRQFRVICVRLDECLPVQRYVQDDARFKGFEAQGVLRFPDVPIGLLEIKPFVDRLGARLDDGTDVPRLPPWRYGVELALIGEAWTASVRHTRARAQDRPGINETATAAYESLNAMFEYRWSAGRHETVLFVQGRNLLDREIRNSVSFLRNYTPEPGRAIEVGLRSSF